MREPEDTALETRPHAGPAAPREQEALYRDLMEQATDGIIVFDDETRVRTVNATACEMLGYERDELLRMRLDGIAEPGEYSRTPVNFEALHAGDTIRSERTLVRKDGSTFPAEINSKRLSNGGFHAFLRDISGRRQAEAELREAHQALRAVVEAAPLAMKTIDLQGRVRMWNPAAERMFGWRADEVIGKPLPTIPPEDRDEFLEMFRAECAGRGFFGYETRRLRRDGSVAEVSVSSAALRDATGAVSGVLVVSADIGDRKKLETQFRQAQKMEAVGRLAAGVAHDFNNLLTAISGYGELIRLDVPEDSQLRSYAGEIMEASQRGAQLTRQLLTFGRRQPVVLKVLDINELVTGLAGLLRRVIGEDIELEISCDPDAGRVRTDQGQMEQAIMNLAVNARDAMPEGGTLSVKTRELKLAEPRVHVHGLVPAGDYAVLMMADSGTGIDPSVFQNIFEPFVSTKSVGQGTGLGLATVYGIVKQSGGHIVVETHPDVGTVFTIYLPCTNAAPEVVYSHAGTRDRSITGTETILLVEDDPAVRHSLGEILANAGYSVLVACGGEVALDLTDDHQGDIPLLITDVVMPRMSGRELWDLLAARRPGMRVLFMSGYTDDVVVRRGLTGLRSVLQKPFSARTLLSRVREILDV